MLTKPNELSVIGFVSELLSEAFVKPHSPPCVSLPYKFFLER